MVAPHVRDFAIQIVMATQPDQKEAHESAKKYIRYGSSPRGAQALVECGRVLALMRGRYHLAWMTSKLWRFRFCATASFSISTPMRMAKPPTRSSTIF